MEYDDLIANLYTAAGVIMEDAGPIALVTGGDKAERIRQITGAGRDIMALAEAASILAAGQD